MPTTSSVLYIDASPQKQAANMGRFFTTMLSCIHNLLIQLPQNGYHNISRVVQPQMRNISDSFVASSSVRAAAGMKKGDIEMRSIKSKRPGTAAGGSKARNGEQAVPVR